MKAVKTVKPRLAATVTILREGGSGGFEVLLLKRSDELAFAPGKWVFAGGKAEPEDFKGVSSELEGLRNAGLREALEETGLNVTGPLDYFMEFTTPGNGIKFQTSFFVALVEPGQQVIVDGSEIIDHQWQSAEMFLEGFRNNRYSLMVPTGLTLMRLAMAESLQEARAALAAPPHFNVKPELHILDDGTKITSFLGDELHSAHANDGLSNCIHRCLFDQEMDSWRYVHSTDEERFPRIDGGYTQR